MLSERLTEQVAAKEALFHELLTHPAIKAVRSKGLLMAVQLDSAARVSETLQRCLKEGLFSDWFLFAADCIRLAPPLTITEADIREACRILQACMQA